MLPDPVTLVVDSFPDPPALDVGVSHAVLLEVAEGVRGATLRLHRPADVVAFGRRDVTAAGYRQAIDAARHHGFAAVERLAGGRAAVFSHGTLAFSWAVPARDPRRWVHDRFRHVAEILYRAFRLLGADARIGEVPGEYCPGAYSISLGGQVKVAGIGQRLVRGAAHVGGVVVVSDADRIRDVLVPVYRALGIVWNPATVGELAGAVPGVGVDDVAAAITRVLAERHDLTRASLSTETIARGRSLAAEHVPAERRRPSTRTTGSRH